MAAVKIAKRIQQRLGRRGAALLAFAFVDLVIGWSLTDAQAQAQAKAVPAYRVIADVMSFEAWGWLWIAVGVICTVSAFCKNDFVGFTAAIGVKVMWAAGLAGAWIVYDVPRAWLGAATWIVLAALVLLISGWDEPREVKR